jgi:hypothetical protein
MLSRGQISELLSRSIFRRGLVVAALTMALGLAAFNPCVAQYDAVIRRPANTDEKEPDPTANCPWLDDIFDDEAMPTNRENREEYYAFNYFVTLARNFSSDLLAKHADSRLTWRVLFDRDRAKYRGKIVHVEGTLKRLTWIGSNKSLESTGVKDLYEAWIFDEHYSNNPTCVVISDLLPGQKTGEDLTGIKASCDGYFFKRYKYRAVNDTRLAPLVIGHTLSLEQVQVTPDAGAEAFSRLFLPTVFTLALGMVALAFILHRWFSKSDSRMQRRLLSARFGDEFIAPIDGPSSRQTHEFKDEPNPYDDGTQ